MAKVIVIGGGPAGMMAAISASKHNSVILVERNLKLGKKMFITGKGRCNVTSNKDISDFFDYIPTNPEFMYSSLYSYTNLDTIKFVEEHGTKLKVERGDRVFPASDKSSDVIKAFERALKESNVKVLLNKRVVDLESENNHITSVKFEDGTFIKCDHVILATGGASYPLTGSTGDGYNFSSSLGHRIIPLKPSLVPVECNEKWIQELKGLTLKNVELYVTNSSGKRIYKNQGEMMFTSYGIAGPLVLSASSAIKKNESYIVHINLKPALDEKDLDRRIQRDFLKYNNKEFKNAIADLFPKQLIPVMVELSGINPDQQANSITKAQRKDFVRLISDLKLTVKGLRPVEEAIVTSGGIDALEIDPSTMRSKLVDNLSFAGEIIDVDAYTGGFNVQIAISTGYIAGINI